MIRLAAAALLAFTPATAMAQTCSTAIALGMDVSRSVDDKEHKLQREATAEALLSPQLADQLIGSTLIYAYEWGSADQQHSILDWTFIATRADLERVANTIATAPRSSFRVADTAVGDAMAHGIAALEGQPCERRVLDISADGRSNDGVEADLARSGAGESVEINALLVGTDDNAATYFEEQVLNGPRAFLIRAGSWEDFAEAIGRKLIRELFITELQP